MNSKFVPNELLPWQNTGKEMLKPTAKSPTDQEPLHTTPQNNRGTNRDLLPAKVLNLDRKEVTLGGTHLTVPPPQIKDPRGLGEGVRTPWEQVLGNKDSHPPEGCHQGYQSKVSTTGPSYQTNVHRKYLQMSSFL